MTLTSTPLLETKQTSPPPPSPRRTRGKNIDPSKSTYEATYNCLKKLNNMTLLQSLNRITPNGNLKIFLVKHNLIKEINPEDNQRQQYLTCRCYSINPKGQEYLKRYESFKELLTE